MLGEHVLVAFQLQRDLTTTSALYRSLLTMIAADLEAGGVSEEVLAQTDPTVHPILDALALRFMAGIHRVVLAGRAPDLGRFYASVGGHHDPDAPTDELGAALLSTIADNRDELVASLEQTVQTNEVGRCAALVLGFLAVARESRPSLRILEIGASAGMNLRWDRFRYEGGALGTAWGDVDSPLRFTDVYEEPLPSLDGAATVVARAGCDRAPIDATTEDGRSLLRSFVWPDQPDRFAMLDAALAVAANTPAPVERADAGDWLHGQLRSLPRDDGVATVVYHSIVWQYLPDATRDRIRRMLSVAGERATPDAPLAWLRMEPGEDPTTAAEVRLHIWPDGVDRVIARSGYHGRPVRSRV
jgi:hypothetical protein